MTPGEAQDRYRQVLACRRPGLTFGEAGERLCLTHQQTPTLSIKALRWEQTRVAQLTAQSRVAALRPARQAVGASRRARLRSVGDVAWMSDMELLQSRSVGPATLAHLRADLATRSHQEAPPVRATGPWRWVQGDEGEGRAPHGALLLPVIAREGRRRCQTPGQGVSLYIALYVCVEVVVAFVLRRREP